MSIEVTMPQMGADMTEGTVVRWLKAVGEAVQRGEAIAEIETDKATVELEAFEEGILQKHVVSEGETVPVGEVIAILGAEGEEIEEVERKPAAETPARRSSPRDAESGRAAAVETQERTAEAAEEAEPPAARGAAPPDRSDGDGAAPPESGGRLRISPVARRIASEAGVDVSAIQGSGPGGRILRRDVEGAMAGKAEAPPREEEAVAERPAAEERPQQARPRAARPDGAAPVQGLSRMRQAIARRMAQSKREQPHYYLTLDIDMTGALAFRKQLNEAATEEQRVSINDLVVKACALAIERHPKFNAEFAEDGLRLHQQINIAIGVALDEGLIAPALLDCGHKTLGQIAREAKGLVDRAKNGGLRADEYGSGTFTITNLGAYGVETLIGIINPPQAAILGVGSVMQQPVVREGQIVARDVMKVALSADHRVTDGAEGARFIKEIQGLLENPASLAL